MHTGDALPMVVSQTPMAQVIHEMSPQEVE